MLQPTTFEKNGGNINITIHHYNIPFLGEIKSNFGGQCELSIYKTISPSISANGLPEEKRDLPWRHTKDPYKIWVSEVMLQQTRVDTVIPYYNRFMEKYPTPEILAYAPEEELLKMWEGFGYYSRVRNLQAGVREVVETYGGKVPDNRD